MFLGGVTPDCATSYNAVAKEQSDAYFECVAKALSIAIYHTGSSCKMGPASDPMAVVDHTLKVHGFDNLRVADASIMPNVVASHPTATCLMIGEKVLLCRKMKVLLTCENRRKVGSGSSGGVLATRLSENANSTVLLLEAGGEPLEISEIPLISFKAQRSKMDWNYFSQPQTHCCSMYKGQKIPMSRGKALGGTSSLNYMTYTRGNKMDFELWQQLGNPGWSYQSVLPYFLKLEDYRVPRSREDDIYHSEGGPMTVSIPTFKTPLADAFLQAGYETGHSLVDYNAKHQTGFMYPPVTVKDGARCSTYSCYLKPVLKRSNLHVLSHSLVTKIIMDDDLTAVGVNFERKSSKCTAKARNEVIISAGVFNTPQLLMLSGIGPRETLRTFDIDLVMDLPGVGQNLQDHVVFDGLSYFVNQTVSFNSVRYETKKYLNLWKKTRTGPMTCPESFEGVAYYQSKYTNVTDWPDIEIFFNSDNVARILKPFIDRILRFGIPADEKDVISFLPILLRPKSRGFVSLMSKNPHDPPIIDPKYLSHPDDVQVLIEGIKFASRLSETKAFKQYGTSLVNGGLVSQCILHPLNTDEYYKCLVKIVTSTGYHPSSTCKMGPRNNSLAVVDHRLRHEDWCMVVKQSDTNNMNAFLVITFIFSTLDLILSSCLDNDVFDYIIVGSGSSGGVVATRLSENANSRVLLIEAGGEPLAISEIPLISFKAQGSEMDWNYFTEPQKHCCKVYKGQKIPMSRGKALGGTSSLNYMTYTRGNKMDFELWQQLGNPGWNYQSVLPYFLKLEDYRVPRSREDDIYHSEGGPMTVSIPTFKTPLADAFLQAGYETGHSWVDYNAKHQTGFMYPPVTVKDGARCSTYSCYLKPVLKRSNLHVLTHSLVTKIIMDDDDKKTAVGVIYERKSSKCIAKARNEVIISAGVFNTPQLLMLSGIGPRETLRTFDIDLVMDLPGVGQNLQDHIVVGGLLYSVNQTVSYNSVRFETQKYLNLWKKTRTGPMTCPESFEGVAYYQSKYTNVTDWPDIEIFFNSDNVARTMKPFIDPGAWC
uniref:Glucose-methanol-choline oxidoreductase N-terminal domain-containing protein n=1 Tax=Strigamia maritima TaxID=126957 RepID=T1J043_STRMM